MVLSTSCAERQTAVADIQLLAKFYTRSAAPLEEMIHAEGASAELAQLYRGIKDIEAKSVAATQAIIKTVEAGDADTARKLL